MCSCGQHADISRPGGLWVGRHVLCPYIFGAILALFHSGLECNKETTVWSLSSSCHIGDPILDMFEPTEDSFSFSTMSPRLQQLAGFAAPVKPPEFGQIDPALWFQHIEAFADDSRYYFWWLQLWIKSLLAATCYGLHRGLGSTAHSNSSYYGVTACPPRKGPINYFLCPVWAMDQQLISWTICYCSYAQMKAASFFCTFSYTNSRSRFVQPWQTLHAWLLVISVVRLKKTPCLVDGSWWTLDLW